MGYCEKNVKFKNRRGKACSKILEVFRDVYEKRKEAYEKFKEEEESVLQAQNDARDEQQLTMTTTVTMMKAIRVKENKMEVTKQWEIVTEMNTNRITILIDKVCISCVIPI